jgi:predicted transcriptional regulator
VSEVRACIHDHVRDNPGVHFNAVARDLDLAVGQVQYHLRSLERDDAVVPEGYYGRTHYYPPDCTDWERGAYAMARRETARDALVYLLDAGPTAPAEVADALGVARSTLEHHVDNLAEQALLAKRRDERNRVTLAVTRPEATVAVLDDVTPSPTGRFVDRFERLLDSFLG